MSKLSYSEEALRNGLLFHNLMKLFTEVLFREGIWRKSVIHASQKCREKKMIFSQCNQKKRNNIRRKQREKEEKKYLSVKDSSCSLICVSVY